MPVYSRLRNIRHNNQRLFRLLLPVIFTVTVICLAYLAQCVPGSIPSPRPGIDGQSFISNNLQEISSIMIQRFGSQSPSQWGEHLPGILSRLDKDIQVAGSPPAVALTLDACGGKPGKSFDKAIITFLKERNIPATIFVTSKWISSNQQDFQRLAAEPLFEIAAHGAAHKPASVNGRSVYGIKGTASIEELVAETEGNVRDIQRLTGKRPRWYRSGTAYYDEIAVAVINSLGLGIAGFSIAADEGATLPPEEVENRILSAQHGDIILCHLNHPSSGTRHGILAALPQLQRQGYVFVTLSEASRSKDR